jgi:hypothetical protein
MGFGWFKCFLFFMVGGARNKLGSTLLTLILTPLKANTPSCHRQLTEDFACLEEIFIYVLLIF